MTGQPDHPQAIYSTGYLSQLVQRSVAEIVEHLEKLGQQPTIVVNGVPHYNETAVNELRKSLGLSAKRGS